MPIDINVTLDRLQKMYNVSTEERGHNFLVYGMMGTGKTYLIQTCRLPILVHSFDPGGMVTLRDKLADPKSGMYADIRFETEDARHPTAWSLWERAMSELERDKVFDGLGTYVIDSCTSWSEALMNQILKQKGKPGGKPTLPDYFVQINTIRDALKKIAGFNCDTLVTGHIDVDKDEVTGRLFTNVLITGKLKVKVPLLFDEVYVSVANSVSGGIERTLLTAPDGRYYARTRLGTGGRFLTYEKPDIKALLKKAGVNDKDKEF